MSDDPASMTRLSLLERLRASPADQAAWEEFVNHYGKRVYRWCRRWGLQDSDAQDVTQDVLVALARQMNTFVYDEAGSFRAWLKTVAHRSWIKFLEHRRRAGLASGNASVGDFLESISVGQDWVQLVEGDSDWALLDQAIARVRRRIQPRTWEAFRLLALEDLSGAAVAGQLGMTIGAVFMARSNVQKLIKEEVGRMQAIEAVTSRGATGPRDAPGETA
jgi:RNA polymerase sigma factor (sigma-70 family)